MDGGPLPILRFTYYMQQDYIFLIENRRIIVTAIAKEAALDNMAQYHLLQ